ncbi:MAG: 4-hydroxythreonine-4-phosphate dehydrogenase PdxA [Pseudomonadota bacterium]|jgi:4-hydroxythreonine-4-phosphate dehydrogenase
MNINQANIKNIAITTGEPAGIGMEISIKSALKYIHNKDIKLTLIGCKDSIYAVSKHCGISEDDFNKLNIYHISAQQKIIQGELNLHNSKYVLDILDEAIQGCVSGKYSAMVTAPIHKGIINEAQNKLNLFADNYKFSGHTEYLAEKTSTSRVIMLLTGLDKFRQNRLRVALATTHIPLIKVSEKISQDKIYQDIICLNNHLKTYFAIQNPHIKIAGLNPHAGEGGHIGTEEQTLLIPTIQQLQDEGINITGPYAGDTMFLQQADCFYCMYHDQGLAPFKYATFGKGVNITLGLPIIRTSVDHGTAIDIANKYCADIDSMIEAINKAIYIHNNIAKFE